jgi:hypothetical protein
MIDYYTRLVDFPITVGGVSVPNSDGSFDIYINANYSFLRQQQVLEHELQHIRKEHFYLDMPVSLMERQADGECTNVILHPPAGYIPRFNSEASLAHWLKNLCAQQHLDLSTIAL